MAKSRLSEPVGLVKVGKRGRVATHGLTPAQTATIRKRLAALDYEAATGDDSKLIEAGLYPEKNEER